MLHRVFALFVLVLCVLVGGWADADLTLFDPENVRDRATFEDSLQYSEGIPYVLVGGRFVVFDGQLVEGATPGQAIRAAD
ncbi:MAG: hypothetical protein QF570_04805 [Myxococcota bacterium]|jgi:N-acyl-D-aspartate/D-glutamate deacylase|nr:hypothetical protein [Myxococcota bacterium]